MSTVFDKLVKYDRSACDGRIAAWDGRLAAVGTAYCVVMPDDGSVPDEDRYDLNNQVTRRWIAEKLDPEPIVAVTMTAKYVRDFITKHRASKVPISVLDAELQLAPALLHFVLAPLLKRQREVVIEMVDFGLVTYGKREAKFGARFRIGETTVLMAPCAPHTENVRVLIDENLPDLLDIEI